MCNVYQCICGCFVRFGNKILRVCLGIPSHLHFSWPTITCRNFKGFKASGKQTQCQRNGGKKIRLIKSVKWWLPTWKNFSLALDGRRRVSVPGFLRHVTWHDFEEPSTSYSYRRKALCSLLIGYPVSAPPPPPLFWLQWCFMPHLQPRSNGSCTAPPPSCHPAATSRLSVLTMEKSASTAIGKWSQRKAGRGGAVRPTASRTLQQTLRVALNVVSQSNVILEV